MRATEDSRVGVGEIGEKKAGRRENRCQHRGSHSAKEMETDPFIQPSAASYMKPCAVSRWRAEDWCRAALPIVPNLSE